MPLRPFFNGALISIFKSVWVLSPAFAGKNQESLARIEPLNVKEESINPSAHMVPPVFVEWEIFKWRLLLKRSLKPWF